MFRISRNLRKFTDIISLDCFDKNTNDLVMTIYAGPAWTVTGLKKDILRRLIDKNAASPQAKIGFEMEYPGRMKVGVMMAATV